MSKHMIGINIGSQSSVVGVLKGKITDVILSETSSRCVPTVVAFSDRERTFGDSALSTIKSNFNRTVVYPNRWLGIQRDWAIVEEEAKYGNIQPTVDKFNKIGFEINYKNETDVYSPESLMGLYFEKLKKNWQNAGYDAKDVVISVPDYYTAHERKAMLEALQLADLTCTGLLNESSAIALSYGILRRKEFDEKTPRIVGFVDMGQSKTTVFFGSFALNVMKVISVTSERFCGAREFDMLLAKHLSATFKKKYGSDPMTSAKCRLRLIDAISKNRKILTGNRETTISAESLMDDEDLTYNLSRDEFEKIIEPVLTKFRNLLKSALEKAMAEAKIQLADIHSIEMVGDAVRTPILQSIIKETFGLEVSKTLLPDECIARGCSLFAAMNSPYYALKDFTFEHYNPYTIILEYPFCKDEQIQIRTHRIIIKGENLPGRKSIKFSEKQTPKQDVIQLKFYYNKDDIPFISNNHLKTYMVSLPHAKEEQWTFALQFVLDINCLPSLDKASLNEIYFEEVPVKATSTASPTLNPTPTTPTPTTNQTNDTNSKTTENTESKAPPTEEKPPEEKKVEEPKTEKVKKERSTVCIVKLVDILYGTPQGILDQMTQREANQENDDKIFRATLNKRNEIENFIYSTRSKLDNELAPFVTSQDKETLISLMQTIEDWLYSGDEEIYVKNTLETKSKDMTEFGQKIYRRYHDWSKLSNSLSIMEEKINNSVQQLNTEFDKLTNNIPTYVTSAECDEINQLISNHNNFLNEAKARFHQFPKFADPPIRYGDVEKTINDFSMKVSNIYSNAEKRVKDEEKRKKEEEEKKKKEEEKKKKEEEEEKKKKEEGEKAHAADATMTDATQEKPAEKKTGAEMEVD